MVAGIYLAVYLVCGVMMVRWLLPRRSPMARAWLGCSLGLLLMMWLPALCAFALRFTWAAHGAALGLLAAGMALCYFLCDRRAPAPWDEKETRLLRQCLLVALPLTVLSGYLQYTHTMRVDEWGN